MRARGYHDKPRACTVDEVECTAHFRNRVLGTGYTVCQIIGEVKGPLRVFVMFCVMGHLGAPVGGFRACIKRVAPDGSAA